MKDDGMYRHPRLHRRGDTYYFRTKVPVDLIAFFPGAEIKFCLRTRDRQVAWQPFRIESPRLDREFDECRKSAAQDTAPLTVITSIDDESIAKLKASFLLDSLDCDTDLRTSPLGEVDYELRQDHLEQQLAALRQANCTGDASLLEGLLKVFLRFQVNELRLPDRDYRRLSLAFLQGEPLNY